MIQRVFTWAVAAWSKVPSGTVSKVFTQAQGVVEALESSDELTGWQKLERAVGQLTALLPRDYASIASTVVTIIVAAARLSNLIREQRSK
jgi:ABC-type molybdate transport system substrate-binding protein